MAFTKVLPTWLVFALWTAITLIGAKLIFPDAVSLDRLISAGPAWNIIAAALFLCIVTDMRDWGAIGFAPPRMLLAIRLSWVPLIFLGALAALSVAQGAPPAATMLITLVNCLFVGVSEEFMFRGLLLRSLGRRFHFWGAAWGSSLAFGLVHSLNALVTGDLPSALIQSGSATMTGFFFLALRIRTGSLLGPILLHGLWDFVLVTFALSLPTATGPDATQQLGDASDFVTSLATGLPLLLLAVFYLRRASGARHFS